MRDHPADPLPKEWLPESPVPPDEDVAYWERRLERVMAEAEPQLRRQRRRDPSRISWVEALALRWRPAAATGLALAAAMVLALVGSSGRRAGVDPRAITLSAVVGEGEPEALWRAAGLQADPTLALIALESEAAPRGGRR